MSSSVVNAAPSTAYVVDEADVLVVGGGPAGCAAALAAARSGARTILVERYPVLGGMWSLGGSDELDTRCFGPGLVPHEPAPASGIARELLDELVSMKAAYPPEAVWAHHIVRDLRGTTAMPIDGDAAGLVLTQLLVEAGVILYLECWFSAPILEAGITRGGILETKSGRIAIRAKVTVDATSDGDVAARSGARYEQDPSVNRMSLVSYWVGVDVMRLEPVFTVESIAQLMDAAILSGDLPAPVDRRAYEISLRYMKPPAAWEEERFTREREVRLEGPHYYAGNPTEAGDLSRAETETRLLFLRFHGWARRHLPGFEHAHMHRLCPRLECRESRRITGLTVLTAEQIMGGQDFPDSIGRGVGDGKAAACPHGIPYGCLVPLDVDGLLVAGSCISMDSAAAKLDSPAGAVPCLVTGQAAGTAAALAAKQNVEPRALSVEQVREALVDQGINLGPPPA